MQATVDGTVHAVYSVERTREQQSYCVADGGVVVVDDRGAATFAVSLLLMVILPKPSLMLQRERGRGYLSRVRKRLKLKGLPR